MSTIAERMAAAAGRVTGTPPDTPTGRWVIDTGDYRIETVRDAYSRRHTFRATAFRQDSAGRLIAAEDATDWTSIDAMATTMRSAARRARTLTSVSDTLTSGRMVHRPHDPARRLGHHRHARPGHGIRVQRRGRQERGPRGPGSGPRRRRGRTARGLALATYLAPQCARCLRTTQRHCP